MKRIEEIRKEHRPIHKPNILKRPVHIYKAYPLKQRVYNNNRDTLNAQNLQPFIIK